MRIMSIDEAERVRERYSRRADTQKDKLYRETLPLTLLVIQERERALLRLLNQHLKTPVGEARALEVGCGNGANLATLIRFGFNPAALIGNELLENRVAQARHRLPSATQLLGGDATKLDLEPESFDIVAQFTVFTSILDDDMHRQLADNMWRWVRPGGGVLWYDFTYDNPSNPDVRGVGLRRIRELFPEAEIDARRVTLAPPLARRIPASLYGVVNAMPFLRTHLVCWLGKPG